MRSEVIAEFVSQEFSRTLKIDLCFCVGTEKEYKIRVIKFLFIEIVGECLIMRCYMKGKIVNITHEIIRDALSVVRGECNAPEKRLKLVEY